ARRPIRLSRGKPGCLPPLVERACRAQERNERGSTSARSGERLIRGGPRGIAATCQGDQGPAGKRVDRDGLRLRPTDQRISLPAALLVDRFHETHRIGRMELKPTDLILRRRTDLGFTRDRHIKYASRLQPTCGAPSRRMAAGFRLACARPSRRAQERAPQDEADWCVEMIRSSIAVPERVWRESN